MINKRRNFKEQMTQQGSMLIELLMSVALAAIIMPFIFKYQQSVVQRAENIAITKQMESIQSALERYIVDNRESLLMTVGKNITRVNISDLEQYGLSPDISSSTSGQYQLRVLKSNDVEGRATLQGVIVFSSDEITPMRTREIVSMGGDSMGFIEGNRAYGTFGAWRADTIDLGLNFLFNTEPGIHDGSYGAHSFLHAVFGIFGDSGWSFDMFFAAFKNSAWITYSLLVVNVVLHFCKSKIK